MCVQRPKGVHHYKYGPLEKIPRPIEPGVTWHVGFTMGLPVARLPRVGDGVFWCLVLVPGVRVRP